MRRRIEDECHRAEERSDSEGVWIIAYELNECWLANEVSAEEHAVADLVTVEFLCEFGAGEGGIFFDGDFESEPGAVGAAAGGVPNK